MEIRLPVPAGMDRGSSCSVVLAHSSSLLVHVNINQTDD